MISMKKLWYCRFLNLYKYSILQSDILYQIATSNILLYFHMVYNCQENKSRILIFLRENSHSLKQLNIFNTYYAYIVVNVIRGINGLSPSIQVLESNKERKVMVDGARWWRWGEHWTRYKWNVFYEWLIVSKFIIDYLSTIWVWTVIAWKN